MIAVLWAIINAIQRLIRSLLPPKALILGSGSSGDLSLRAARPGAVGVRGKRLDRMGVRGRDDSEFLRSGAG